MDDSVDKRDSNVNDKDQLRKKKKNTFSQKEVYSDGYDSEGYKDDDDKKKLMQMNEVDRQIELTKRLEERNNKKFDDKIAEKAEKVKTTTGGTGSTSITTEASNSVDQSKKNQVEKDRIQHKKELETRREKYKESHSHASNNDYASSQYDDSKHHTQGLAQHQRERNTQSDEFQKLVKQLTLSNDFLNKLILRSNFKDLVKGAYVKVRIGTKYEIYRIDKVTTTENNSTIFSLNNGIKNREIDLKFISNQTPDQVELCTYYEQNYRHEKLQTLQDKKKQFDDMLTKKSEKSEKQKYEEIDHNISHKIEQGYFDNENNLNANELKTFIGFLKDRLLDIEYNETNQLKTFAKPEIEKMMKDKQKFQRNKDYLEKKTKLVADQIVPIYMKNVLAVGSKISEQALNKKFAKIKDKQTIRRQKIQRLQQPYFAFEEQFKLLSQYTTSVQFKDQIKLNHLSLKLSSQVSKDLSSIDCSDQAMQSLIVHKK